MFEYEAVNAVKESGSPAYVSGEEALFSSSAGQKLSQDPPGQASTIAQRFVLASLASERLGQKVHPNDHVNASQSSNDVFPSAIHLAATQEIVRDLIPALEQLSGALRQKSRQQKQAASSPPAGVVLTRHSLCFVVILTS